MVDTTPEGSPRLSSPPHSEHSPDGIISDSYFGGNQLEYYEKYGYPPGYEWMQQSPKEDVFRSEGPSTVSLSPHSPITLCDSNLKANHQNIRSDIIPDHSPTLSCSQQPIRSPPTLFSTLGHFKVVPSLPRQHLPSPDQSVRNSIRSIHRHAKSMRCGRFKNSTADEGDETRGDEVQARIFRCQRDKRIEHQLDLVRSALKDIKKELQSLRESLVHDQL